MLESSRRNQSVDIFLSAEQSLRLLFLLTEKSQIDQKAILEYFSRQAIDIKPTIEVLIQGGSLKKVQIKGEVFLQFLS